jgi:hypothetical protein
VTTAVIDLKTLQGYVATVVVLLEWTPNSATSVELLHVLRPRQSHQDLHHESPTCILLVHRPAHHLENKKCAVTLHRTALLQASIRIAGQ